MLEMPAGWPQSVVTLVMKGVESGRALAIREALNAIRELPATQRGRRFNLGICRTFTVEAQLDTFALALATLPCQPEITLGDLENVEQLLLEPASSMLQAKLDAALVLWRLEDLHPRLVYEYDAMSADERASAAQDVIDRIERLCSEYTRMADAPPLFLSTLPDALECGAAMNDVYTPHAPRRAIARVNNVLLDLAVRNPRVHLFDFAGWTAREGCGAFDLKMGLFARQPIAARAAMSFSAALADCFRPLLCAPAKVLAIDLDNVLWGGVLGEDGTDGLKIGHDFPGNIYRRIQQHALALRRRGVLLVLLSKNNLTDVEQAFATLPDMPLKLSDFAAARVNWREKHENVKEIADELNLGLDSFVFVDDQAFEREQMHFNLPDVKVLSASDDPLQTLRVLTECRAFDVHRVSEEDRQRSADYAAQAQRRQLEAGSGDSTAFLHTLQLQARITRVAEPTVARVVQMLAKTNQFNVTTRRHTEADIRRMMSNPANVLLVLSLSDRFGDQGIVGLAIALENPDPDCAEVDSFLFSCRALGRDAELALWSALLSNVSRIGYTALRAEYRRTSKNEQVACLFDRFGMTRLESRSEDHSQFVLHLPAVQPSPAWINVIDETSSVRTLIEQIQLISRKGLNVIGDDVIK